MKKFEKLVIVAPVNLVGHAKEELKEAKNAMKKLGLELERIAEFPIEDTAHGVIVLRKVAHTPAQYPRRYAKIKQSPL